MTMGSLKNQAHFCNKSLLLQKRLKPIRVSKYLKKNLRLIAPDTRQSAFVNESDSLNSPIAARTRYLVTII